MSRLEKPLVDLVEKEQPDIFNLQEVLSYPDGYAGIITTIEKLQQRWQFPHVFYAPLVSFSYLKSTAQFGNAILSRLPMTSTDTIFTGNNLIEDFNFEDHDYNVRNLQHALFVINGKDVHVLNHHGHHVPDHKDGTDETDRQMQQIAEYIDSLSGPIILTGDFNLQPESRSLQPLHDRLRNLSVENNLKTTRNHLTGKLEVCDYIFVNESVTVKRFAMLDKVVSDHAALVVEFDV